jgi:UDP-glucose 4-epimerase
LSRHAPPANLLPSGIDVRIGDICDADAVRSATAGTTIVVHLAALLHQFQNAADLDRQFERVNVGGTENVVGAAISEGVRRVVFLSTVAVYGPSSAKLLHESTRPAPNTPYGRTKLRAEQLVLSAGQAGTVLRAAAAYGPRVKGNYRRLAEAIVRRRFVQVGACRNRRTVVYDSDLAQAAVLAAEHPAAAGAVFNVSDGDVHALADIIDVMYRAVGRRPPRLNIPVGAAYAGAILCEKSCRLAGVRPPISHNLLDKYTEDVAVDATLIQRTLGFAPKVDLHAGWHETMMSVLDDVRGAC